MKENLLEIIIIKIEMSYPHLIPTLSNLEMQTDRPEIEADDSKNLREHSHVVALIVIVLLCFIGACILLF